MTNLKAVLKQLQSQRAAVQADVQRIDSALTVLGSLDGAGRGRRGGPRHLSAAARNRIAMAQKARWAQWKAKRR
jgi:hypothetical protein